MSKRAESNQPMILPPDWPPADEAIGAALAAAWRDGSWARYDADHSRQLCAALAERFQTEHVLLCSSGTVAAQIALRGLNVGPGDEVILAGYDYPGNFRSIESVGARPVLVDVVADGATIDPAQLDLAWSPATRAVIVSHLHGAMAPMRQICDWARGRNVAVVEDACQVPGARVDGKPAGAWGDAGLLSFGGSKLLTAGRGGAMITARADVAQRARVYCQQGNHAFPLSELQAAVLLPQLAKLDEWNGRRAASVKLLHDSLAGASRLRPIAQPAADAEPAYYKVAWFLEELSSKPLRTVPILRVPPSKMGLSPSPDVSPPDAALKHSLEDADGDKGAATAREAFIAAAAARGVPIDAGFRGFVHRTARRCRRVGELPESKRAAEQLLVLHHPILLEPDETIRHLAKAILETTQE